jgi:hypothetical protein
MQTCSTPGCYQAVLERPPGARGRPRKYCEAHRARPDTAAIVARQAEHMVRLDAIKAATPCADCGRQFPAPAMDFHHRDPADKTFTISQRRGMSWAKLEAEIAKCDVLCAVCHRLRHHNLTPGDD